jgi:hypothetical protein
VNDGDASLFGVHDINQHFLTYRCAHFCVVPFRVLLQV